MKFMFGMMAGVFAGLATTYPLFTGAAVVSFLASIDYIVDRP